MIKAYLAGIPSLYEGEDIEVRYCIYENQELLCKESVMIAYKKPAVVGQVALITLLNKLKKYTNKEIEVIVNNPALYEIVRGTSTTKNGDVLKMVGKMNKELIKFGNIVIKDVSGNHVELMEWNEVLRG